MAIEDGWLVRSKRFSFVRTSAVVEPLDRRDGGAGADGDDDPPGPDGGAVELDGTGSGDGRATVTDGDALGGHGVVVLSAGDRLDGVTDAGHRVVEGGASCGGGEQRLGGHAPREGAVATDRAVLDQDDGRAAAGGGLGGRDATGAAADHDEVGVIHGVWSSQERRRQGRGVGPGCVGGLRFAEDGEGGGGFGADRAVAVGDQRSSRCAHRFGR